MRFVQQSSRNIFTYILGTPSLYPSKLYYMISRYARRIWTERPSLKDDITALSLIINELNIIHEFNYSKKKLQLILIGNHLQCMSRVSSE